VTRAEVLVAAEATLGEGPLWDAATGDIIWVDIDAAVVLRTNLDAADLRTQTCEEPVGSLGLTAGGGLVGATPTGLRRLDIEGAPYVGHLPEYRPDVRANDGKAAPGGRFIVGTMGRDVPVPGVGSLWSFGGGLADCLISGTTIPNGLAWTADGTTMYFIDTPTREVVALEYNSDTGGIGRGHTAVAIGEGLGDPDGMCIDAEGGLWIALWGGSAVHRYVDGRLAAVIEVPTPLVTCPAFAGSELDQLVITTASAGLDSDATDGAGHLYVANPGVVGAEVGSVGAWADSWN